MNIEKIIDLVNRKIRFFELFLKDEKDDDICSVYRTTISVLNQIKGLLEDDNIL